MERSCKKRKIRMFVSTVTALAVMAVLILPTGAFADTAGAEAETGAAATGATETEATETRRATARENKIYFIGGTSASDFMLLETKEGNYALIDAGDREAHSLPGYEEGILDVQGLRNDVGGKTKLLMLMDNVIKNDAFHIDFIIATHAHSDHIGGIDEICDIKNKNGDYIIDGNTALIYKQYIGDYRDGAELKWYNDEFVDLMVASMQERGAKIVELSTGLVQPNRVSGTHPGMSKLAGAAGIGNARFVKGRTYFGDSIEFKWHDYSFAIYNIYINKSIEENTSSLATLIKCDGHTFMTQADMTMYGGYDIMIAREIKARHGFINIDVMKENHHGGTYHNNRHEQVDIFKPKVFIVNGTVPGFDGDSVLPIKRYHEWYAAKNYNTCVYTTADNNHNLAINMSTLEITSFNTNCKERSARRLTASDIKENVASGWMEDGMVLLNDTTYEVLDGIRWRFIEDGEQVSSSWVLWRNRWYYMDDQGYMLEGWLWWNNKWYYLEKSGAMKTGWLKYNDKWYYMDSTGAMKTGWVRDNFYWYYMDNTGAMKTGWQLINGVWYYLHSSGAMAEREWVNGYWLNSGGAWTYQPRGSWYLSSNGRWWFGDTSGWYAKSCRMKINGLWYAFDDDGYMA